MQHGSVINATYETHEYMVHVYNNALIIMQDDAHDQVFVAFNIWDVTTTLPMQ
jgi:hypothetical protein